MRALWNHERVALLRERGGLRSLSFWLLRKALALDVYTLFALPLRDAGTACPPGCTLLRLVSEDDLARCPDSLLDQIGPHTGAGVRQVLAQGGRIYALVEDGAVRSQTRIDVGTAHTDTPCPLTCKVGPRNAFLSFLYTHPSSRRGGWAKKLLVATASSMAQEGLQICLSHVQATNLRSVNTFLSLGWQHGGWLLASRGGRYLGTVGAHRDLRVVR
ncbi:GNAT family N-acetyltransferase [Massilia sp. LXY-6]|uniref:GNAT family N-acetyltransferase n=1 Tax=Massilia sp. LXY-6 TaxID=3379823 RepID=UPI003EE3611B